MNFPREFACGCRVLADVANTEHGYSRYFNRWEYQPCTQHADNLSGIDQVFDVFKKENANETT